MLLNELPDLLEIVFVSDVHLEMRKRPGAVLGLAEEQRSNVVASRFKLPRKVTDVDCAVAEDARGTGDVERVGTADGGCSRKAG